MSGESKNISAAVMVYNGIHTIGRCIDSLSFCDEIVVVDDYSNDGTWEYLQKAPVVAIRHQHTTFAEQREFARDLTKGTWLLTMDADEYITPELADEIKKATAREGIDGFYIKRRNPYPKGLNGINWSWHPRLIKKAKCKWEKTDNPHSPLDKSSLRLKRLRGAYMDHEPIESVAVALRKSINRSLILAEQLRARNKNHGAIRMTISSIGRFIKMFISGGGWKYGRDGFVWACLQAFEAWSKYAFLISNNTSAQGNLDGGPGSYPSGAPVVSKDAKP
jgi:glycosyltransferase involved in cell wall biosynthesis